MSLSYDDIPGFSFKRALNMMEAFWGALERINYFSELFESNESTMEKSNKNPVSPPAETITVTLREHINFNIQQHNGKVYTATYMQWPTTVVINPADSLEIFRKNDSINKVKEKEAHEKFKKEFGF